jgi:transcription-repair coupling factor (superfamily II helicase)
VETILPVRDKLEALLPEARIRIGHGQMREHELEQTMEKFVRGEVDVLLCTSIIESGLDIPNANTLIVDRADTFGLAQLYQLRGRVGRGPVRAYAYFFTDRRHRPTPEAYQRLETLAEQTELGAGYAIAMRDLEIRGAGEILGTRQSGHIAAIGFHLYTRLLAQAVRRLRAERDGIPPEMEGLPPSVDLPLAAALPEDYVPDRDLRFVFTGAWRKSDPKRNWNPCARNWKTASARLPMRRKTCCINCGLKSSPSRPEWMRLRWKAERSCSERCWGKNSMRRKSIRAPGTARDGCTSP